MAQVAGFVVRNWAVGYGHETGRFFIKFDFASDSTTVSLTEQQAEELGKSLLETVRTKPPKPDRLS
jgi:hypothetical protein